MHIGIGTRVASLIGVEIDLVGQDGGAIRLDILRQDLRLLGMTCGVRIRVAAIVCHKGHVVFPATS